MAARADLYAQHLALHGGASLESVAAGAMYGYLVIVGMNTGFHDAPFCRVRSARRTGSSPVTTAASLGREAIFDDTRRLDESKTWGASEIVIVRQGKDLALAGAPFFGGDFPDFGGEAAGDIVAVFGGDQAHALLFGDAAGGNIGDGFRGAQDGKVEGVEPKIGDGFAGFGH